MILILDYGLGNVFSVRNMIRKIGFESIVSNSKNDIKNADKLIIPGVGHFDYGMRMLESYKLIDCLNDFAMHEKKPVLGICLGAQMLGKNSEEGEKKGLGWLDMNCLHFPMKKEFKVPHMGWSHLNVKSKVKSKILNSITNESRFYFVHSYYMKCNNEETSIATTNYMIEYTCVVNSKNIFGCQFHPEKSLKHGMKILENFIKL